MRLFFARPLALIVAGLLMPACGSSGGGNSAERGGAEPASSASSLPPAPTGLTATPGDRIVILSWTAVSGAGGYNVKRAAASQGPFVPTAVFFPDTTFVDRSLRNGTRYYYVVSAVNNIGEGAESLEVSATPGESPGSGSDSHDGDHGHGHDRGGEGGDRD